MSSTPVKKKPASKLEKIHIPGPAAAAPEPQPEPVSEQQPVIISPAVAAAAPAAEPAPVKKRGRKRKIALDKKYTDNAYITMWPEICMGQKILIDRHDNVYTYDLETPRWLGIKTVDGRIDTTQAPRIDYHFTDTPLTCPD